MFADGAAEDVARLFARAVPEIAAGVIEIRAVARKPGYRIKVAVSSSDPKVDAVGACVGVRGSRIKNVIDELDGERIDIVRWNDAPEQLIANLLQPACVRQVVVHPVLRHATVVVDEDQLSLASGRRGLNRELASQASGWEITLATRPPSRFWFNG
jgi:N utilization substance protein A